MGITRDTPIWQLSVGQFQELIRMTMAESPQQDSSISRYAFGISGLAELLQVGKTKAQEIKNSGILDAAIQQRGRKIVIDSELALKLYSTKE